MKVSLGRCLLASVFLGLTATTLVSSFTPSFASSRNAFPGFLASKSQFQSPWPLHAEYADDEDCSKYPYVANEGPWKVGNDFNFFLTQCAVQSFVFLVNSLRDRHTAIWLEDFTQPIIHKRTKDKKEGEVLTNMAKALNDAMHETQMERQIELLTYHGLEALNTTLFTTWDSYFEKLLLEPGITYSIESTRPHVPNYELEINPASLCSRIISVREQIAREFVKDLDVLADTSERMLQSYFEKSKEQQNSGVPVELERPNLLFLEMSADQDYTPSPLRKGNFDLLTLLATQESIHRILNDASMVADNSPDKSSVQFLRNFYAGRVGTHFTGSTWYGRADDFIEELLKAPPSVVQLQDEECGLVDPVRVAELILKQREQVAEEWLEVSLDVPMSHTDIKRWQLNKLLEIDETAEKSFE